MEELPLGLIFTLLCLIFLSAFFSSTETAFSSVNIIRLKNYADEGRRGSKNALYIAENFDKALSTILVGNNIVNIAATSIATKLATDLVGGTYGIFVSTTVMTVLILIFGEVLPKSIAKERAEEFSLSISGILLFLMKILSPITYFFIQIKNGVMKLVGEKEASPSITEEEIKVMVNISEEEGVIENHEKELLHRSLDFNDILVGEILTPRMDMIAIDSKMSNDEIFELFLQERYSRVPVYEEYVDNIIGILYERDFLTEKAKKNDFSILSLLRDAYFVVESMKIATLLPELQKSKIHMAIVVDEFGGTSGLITLEDIIEEIVGDIWDEHDEKIMIFTKINDNNFECNADIPLADFFEMFSITNESIADYHTLGGWLFEKFERIPNEGESLTYGKLVITIKEVESRRIRKVLVEKMS